MITREKARQYEKKYRERNKERYLENRRRWRRNHKEYYRNYQKNWIKRNPEKREIIRKNSYIKNRIREIKKSREWNIKNKERFNRNWMNWAKRNPEKITLRWEKRNNLKRNVKLNFNAKDWEMKKRKTNGYCKNCKRIVGYKNLTMDHIIPISKVPKGFVYELKDVQVICKTCNSRKNNKTKWRNQQ